MAIITDKTVTSKYQPKSTNVFWVDTSLNPPVEKHFINGIWKPIGGGGDSEIFDEYIDATDQQRNTALANVSNQTANSTTGKMGYKVLDPTKTFASQVTAENTIYEIRDVFDLNGGSVTIPASCTLKFEGGKLLNGAINGVNTNIIADPYLIFDNINVNGTFNGDAKPEWLGSIEDTFSKFKNVHLVPNKHYYLQKSIVFDRDSIFDGNNAFIHIPDIDNAFVLGYFSQIKNVTLISNSCKNIIDISTNNMSRTYNQNTGFYVAHTSILIENVNIVIESGQLQNTYDCIRIVSDGYRNGGSALSGFFGVVIDNVNIRGPWKNGLFIATGTKEASTEQNTWLTDCKFNNIFTNGCVNSIVIDRIDEQSVSNGSKPRNLIFTNCSGQHQEVSESFIIANKCTYSEFHHCQGWDFTGDCIFVNRDYCENLSFISTYGGVKLGGTSPNMPMSYYDMLQNFSDKSTTLVKEDYGYTESHTLATTNDMRRIPDGIHFIAQGYNNYAYFRMPNLAIKTGHTCFLEKRTLDYFTFFILYYTNMYVNSIAYCVIARSDPDSDFTWSVSSNVLTSYNSLNDIPSSDIGNGHYVVVNSKLCYSRYADRRRDALGRTFNNLFGTTSQRPSNLLETIDIGYLYFDTTLGKYICWNGTDWVNLDGTALS